ncbi:MutS domain V protein [Cooperia oncophora]
MVMRKFSEKAVIRPRFGSSIIINEGRHPLLDYSIGDQVVSNDTYLTTDSRVVIITGPNMTGKSTYLKQVCQLCVLAQSGCFVPAKIAVLPVKQWLLLAHCSDMVKRCLLL